ncbi:MAG TPA: divalent-cation tolerance protein CutA [Alphaproteobacteria bacterium]|nr:divalent-cation tolerance protein CutA [Alphaproteobacteria bacterium]
MGSLIVEITAGSPVEAERIGRLLVEERLASCVNFIPGIRSIYRWKGRVEEASETLLLAKTVEAALPELIARVRALHSYECPCITALPIIGGNPDYLVWIEAECAPRSPHGSHAGSDRSAD